MSSYEKQIQETIDEGKDLPAKLDFNTIKYFWESNPLVKSKKDSVPRFLSSIYVFKNFSENELRILSKYLHLRTFSEDEIIFNQNDSGIGFYLVYSGHVDIIVDKTKEGQESLLLSLERTDYFGELALLQEQSTRNATAISRDNCQLLGIFQPDLEQMINLHPTVAAKLLQSISMIIANRLYSITQEVKILKYKMSKLEVEKENE